MQIRDKITLIIACILSLSIFGLNLHADEFNISASQISIDKKNNIVIGEGNVEVTDSEGKLIKANKVTYKKEKEFLLLEGSVEVIDVDGNILKTPVATYDKKEERITASGNSELILNFTPLLLWKKLMTSRLKKQFLILIN